MTNYWFVEGVGVLEEFCAVTVAEIKSGAEVHD
jgi:hypothetical protein